MTMTAKPRVQRRSDNEVVISARQGVAFAHAALAARGETPARRRAVIFTRDRGGEAMTPLVPARCAELRQRRARVKDTSDARASFATGC